MLISILEKINNINEILFTPIDNFIGHFPLEGWISDAIIDCVHMLPLLFIIFILIELLEFYFSEKIDKWIEKANRSSVVVGALSSILPQCGFSVIASGLYSRKLITRGCLIAVYLGTSDESIPILLAYPNKAHLIIPIIGIKLFVAILFGYFIDCVLINDKYSPNKATSKESIEVHEDGCCNHNPDTKNKKELLLHPLLHTTNIFCFILAITLIINYIFNIIPADKLFILHSHKYLQCFVTSFVGLIPNCAISIAITMMLIKGTITFGAAMSGLLSNAGLGLLVLLRNNDFKDTVKIISLLFVISLFVGLSIQFLFS